MIPGTTFIPAYRATATQMRDPQIAGNWWRLHKALDAAGIGLTADQAAAWADQGCTPDEAEPMIRQGITPQAYAEMEAHAEEQAGGPDNLAATRVAELLGSGQLLGPDDVIRVPDPTNPNVEIIVARDDIEEDHA